MEINGIELKKGDLVKIKSDLPINDPNFRSEFPGWESCMSEIVGKWVSIVSIVEESNVALISFKKSYFYVSYNSIDMEADSKYAKKLFINPNVGDWVIYHECDQDQEIATVGKVTRIDGEKDNKTYSIDGFDGYRKVYLFDGDLGFLEAIRRRNV